MFEKKSLSISRVIHLFTTASFSHSLDDITFIKEARGIDMFPSMLCVELKQLSII